MVEFLKTFSGILKIFLIVFIITLFFGMVIFFIIYYDDIIRFKIIYSNFNLIKLILIKIEPFLFLFIPSILIFSSFLTSFFVRKRMLLTRTFISLIILNIIFFVPLYIFILNSPVTIKKLKNAYKPVMNKNYSYFEKNRLYVLHNIQYYFINNKVIQIKNGKFNYFIYKYNNNLNEVLLYSKGKIVDKINFSAGKSRLFSKKIKYINKINSYFNEFYKFLISNKRFFYIIYYFMILILFILIPGIYSYDLWSFNEFFIYSFLSFIFLYLFIVSFHFTIYYLIDLKISKSYIYFFPVIVFLILDVIIILIENNRMLKKKLISRIKR